MSVTHANSHSGSEAEPKTRFLSFTRSLLGRCRKSRKNNDGHIKQNCDLLPHPNVITKTKISFATLLAFS